MSRAKVITILDENNAPVYVQKRFLDLIHRKAIILDQQVIGGSGGKLIIKYKNKRGSGHGVMELYDLGPTTH